MQASPSVKKEESVKNAESHKNRLIAMETHYCKGKKKRFWVPELYKLSYPRARVTALVGGSKNSCPWNEGFGLAEQGPCKASHTHVCIGVWEHQVRDWMGRRAVSCEMPYTLCS